jgi:hypothetical protein
VVASIEYVVVIVLWRREIRIVLRDGLAQVAQRVVQGRYRLVVMFQVQRLDLSCRRANSLSMRPCGSMTPGAQPVISAIRSAATLRGSSDAGARLPCRAVSADLNHSLIFMFGRNC